MSNPTKEIYDFLTQVCNAINKECFSSELPEVLLTVKGKGRVFGYYKKQAFISHDGKIVDEIAVNPAYFATHGFKELLQTLAHEMCHQWQYTCGTPSIRSYHNREFADKMKSIGLMPSTTGKEGGAETGQNMADYMAETGFLPDLYKRLKSEGVIIPWYERLGEKVTMQPLTEIAPSDVVIPASTEKPSTANNTTRAKYTHQCKDDKKPSIIYGKPTLHIKCGVCNEDWKQD
jgi:hypothetical protein